MRLLRILMAVTMMIGVMMAGCAEQIEREAPEAAPEEEAPASDFEIDTSELESDLDLSEIEDIDSELESIDW